MQDPLRSMSPYCLPYTTVPRSLCSPVMCLLRWKQVIEWDNLRTQGLVLLLATIFSEERRFSHCLLNLFLRADTHTPTCAQKYRNPFWKQSTYSDTATANIPSNRQQVLNHVFGTKRNDYFLYKLNKREPNSHPLFAPTGSCLLI